ncbi:MAG: carboxypeptidase-like regulatory domain-containing protein [Cyclobacteriaceae bacterium]
MKLIALITIFISPWVASAQNITGLVIDGSGEALPGANVFHKHNPSIGTTTDPDGKFTLLANKGDTLLVRFIGFKESQLVISTPTNYSISLEADKKQMEEVVVKAERLIAEEFTQKKIKKLEIYTNPSAKADPILAVSSSPSATTTDESANISLRGSSPVETGIFLNNVPINDAVRYSQLNGIGTFSIFSTALIKEVLVFPGNPPLEFGNTTSGLIALQTDEVIPKKPVNTVSLTLASMGLYTQRPIGKKSSLTAFSNYQPSTFIKTINKSALEQLKKFNSIDLGIHYYLQSTEQSVIKVFNYTLRESYQFQYQQPTVSGIFDQKKVRNFTVANYRYRLKKGELSFNNGLSFSNSRYNFSTIDLKLEMKDFFTSINYQHFMTNAEIKGGISYDYKKSDFDGTFPQYDYAVGEPYPTLSTTGKQHVALPETYIYGKYFLTPQIIVGGALRQSIPIENQSGFLSKQFNIKYQPVPELNVILATGTYNKYQLPQGTETDPFIISSLQHSFDLAYNTKKLETSFSLFHKQAEQKGVSTKVNGLEIYGKYTINRNVKTQLSLTSLDANMKENDSPSFSPFDIGYFIRGNVEYKFLGTWTITTVFLFREGSYYKPVISALLDESLNVYQPTFGRPSRLPNYNSIDLSISKLLLIKKKYSSVAFIGLGNLIDFTNVRDYSYNFDYSNPTANLFSRRTVYFGLVVNF